MLSGGFLCPAAQQAGPGQHGCDGEEQRHHIRLLPDALKHAVDQHADEAAQHARAKRRPAATPNISLAPTARRTRYPPRNQPAAARAFSTLPMR